MKRRSFITKTTLGLSGIAATTSALAPVFASCSGKNKKIELAVIGGSKKDIDLITGSLQTIQHVNIKTVFDFDNQKSRETCQSIRRELGYFPAQAKDMKTVFQDRETDGVFIFLPEHWRAAATIRACEAGKDVYVEALPAHSIPESKQMRETAKKNRRIIQCGYLLRSSPAVKSAESYIGEGRLGQVVHVKIVSLQNKKHEVTFPEAGIPEGFEWKKWLGPLIERPYNPEIYSRRNVDGWKTFREFTTGRMSGAANGLDLARQVTGNTSHPSAVFGYERSFMNNSRQKMPERQIVTWNFEKYTMTCDSGEAYRYMKSHSDGYAGEKNLSKWLLLGNRVEIYGTAGLMYLDSDSGSWQVQGKDGEILANGNEDDAGSNHIVNFISCMQSRDIPAGNIQQGHLSAALAHMGNIACESGNNQLVFDKESETFINNEKANALLKPAYREEFAAI